MTTDNRAAMIMQPAPVRRMTLAPGSLVDSDGKIISCVVLNISPGGARIEVDWFGRLPDQFRLLSDELRLSADAQIVWRLGSHAGVRFLRR